MMVKAIFPIERCFPYRVQISKVLQGTMVFLAKSFWDPTGINSEQKQIGIIKL
jgi:hypothetical protein